MNRTGLVIALAVAVIGGGLFAAFPQLDIAISRLFYHPEGASFPVNEALNTARDFIALAIGALAGVALLAVLLKLIAPRQPMMIPARAAILLIVTIALGPGVLTNVLLKDHWGRERPYSISEFRGDLKFTPWWDPRGQCRGNCSFIAGEPSGAFWTMAPAAVLVPPPYQPLAYLGAVALGTGVGLMRVALGGHFASDVIFAGVFMYLLIWFVYGLLYRWPRTRTTDEALERHIGNVTLPLYDFLALSPQKKRPASRERAGRKKRKVT